ncbi:MAG: PstS family phosphate ABC transporter substrate-binding protein [Spirochaetaceae bacterium]|nr:PstS family phosphate ABC transporter substrate-binding protein [Spirochaetaceae bacterium]
MSDKQKKITATAIVAIVLTVLLIVPVLMGFVGFLFMGEVVFAFLVPVVAILLIWAGSAIVYAITNRPVQKRIFLIPLFFTILFSGYVLTSLYYKYSYLPSIRVSQKELSSYYYKPFTDSPYLARLDEKASLQFTLDEELPRLDGATALFPVYCSFVEATYHKQADIKSLVQFSRTTKAYENLIKGETDIIFVAGPSKEQMTMAKEAGVEFQMYPIGYEAFVFIVNSKNPVSNISIQQIRDIYSGKITRWSELGGNNAKIRPFQRDKNSGSQTAFEKIFGKENEMLAPEMRQVASGMGGLVDAVADYENHSNAIGYSFRYYIETMENNPGIKILSLSGIAPTKETIRNKTYPICDSFYAITVKSRETENVKRFIEWMQGSQAQALIEKVGYVGL